MTTNEQQQQSLLDRVRALRETSATFDNDKADYRGEAGAFRFVGGKLQLPEEMSGLFPSVSPFTPPLSMTDHAFGQVRNRLGPILNGASKTLAKHDWTNLRQHYPEQFDHVANDLLRRYSQRDGARISDQPLSGGGQHAIARCGVGSSG
jgi:hypothetical protein